MKVLLVLCCLSLFVGLGQSAKCSNALQTSLDYWTPERMANAIPMERRFNVTSTSNLGACSANYHKHTTSAPYNQYPFTAIGKVYFSIGSSNYVCSGSIGDGQRGLVWTAGHCVFGSGKFHNNWLFVPGFFNNQDLHGSFAAHRLCTTDQYHQNENMGYDYAIAIMQSELPANLGEFELSTGYNQETTTFVSNGYPQGAPFNGMYENTCQSSACYIDNNFQPSTTGISCDSTGGSSGGPWTVPSGSRYKIASVNSYGYGSLPNYMFGPYFNSATQTFLSDVSSLADSTRLASRK